MNIIFLDIDGVLNCQVFYEEKGWTKDSKSYEEKHICKKRLKWLQNLCRDTNSKLVISSTWRMGKTIGYFADTFINLGVELPVIDLTSVLYFTRSHTSVPRGCEIKEWLDKTDLKYDNYAIIDDDGDMLLEQAVHFFQTDAYSGLTPFICQRIRKLFKP